MAKKYAEFLEHIANGREIASRPLVAAEPASEPARETVTVEPEYILSWSPDAAAKSYIETHLTRLEKTLAITPPGGPGDRILEMGAYLQITPALQGRSGLWRSASLLFRTSRAGSIPEPARRVEGEQFSCDVELFDAEKDRFSYDDEYFSTVLCCELLEHLTEDPMHMMSEINRILKPGGHLVLTTPNIGSLRAIAAILEGYHPGFFPAYIRAPEHGAEPEARHNREYTPKEIVLLLLDSGFEVALLETGPFREQPKPELAWVRHLLQRYQLSQDLRGDGIYAVGRKIGPLRERYPAWLYQ